MPAVAQGERLHAFEGVETSSGCHQWPLSLVLASYMSQRSCSHSQAQQLAHTGHCCTQHQCHACHGRQTLCLLEGVQVNTDVNPLLGVCGAGILDQHPHQQLLGRRRQPPSHKHYKS